MRDYYAPPNSIYGCSFFLSSSTRPHLMHVSISLQSVKEIESDRPALRCVSPEPFKNLEALGLFHDLVCRHILECLHRGHYLVSGVRFLFDLPTLIHLTDTLRHCYGHLFGGHLVVLPFGLGMQRDKKSRSNTACVV